ncbi:hypothetical protein Htur_1270 [Haloterrigena turkmenica DSM 5511]|uniref:Uncharacterized protein n=1 Tax=Haloterrigena turkmenica (strain ATCC 51198 / DSM 5511 / JCM 9101 / NCIMB 13204 / VKM B-1734 / 4k) TaxID=543526 RepID=D2RPC6_HALTV|nr:hypothetical protein Htur_1270 [Haloterrigena turkmenica DSM 5511]
MGCYRRLLPGEVVIGDPTLTLAVVERRRML